MQLDAMRVGGEPALAVSIELVPRSVVDNEKDFASSIAPDELLEKSKKAIAAEDRFEAIAEVRFVE